MKPTLRKEILTETYKDIQKLMSLVVWNFWRIHGGDFDDLISQANLIFVEAFDAYGSSKAKSKSKPSTWFAYKIRNGLFDYVRNGNRHELKYTLIDDEFIDTYPGPNKDFSVMELLDELEQDTHIVLQLFLDTPREIMLSILDGNRKTNHQQAAMRNRLRNRLRQMGWTVRRIRKAFEEIKSVTSY